MPCRPTSPDPLGLDRLYRRVGDVHYHIEILLASAARRGPEPQYLSELAERPTFLRQRRVRVDRHRDFDGGMTEDLPDDMRGRSKIYDTLLSLIGLGAPVFAHYLTEPIRQILRDGPVHRGDRYSLIGTADQFGQLLPGILVASGISLDPLVGVGSARDISRITVAAVFPQPDAALAVRSPALPRPASAAIYAASFPSSSMAGRRRGEDGEHARMDGDGFGFTSGFGWPALARPGCVR